MILSAKLPTPAKKHLKTRQAKKRIKLKNEWDRNRRKRKKFCAVWGTYSINLFNIEKHSHIFFVLLSLPCLLLRKIANFIVCVYIIFYHLYTSIHFLRIIDTLEIEFFHPILSSFPFPFFLSFCDVLANATLKQ